MFEKATARSRSQTLCSSKVNWKNILLEVEGARAPEPHSCFGNITRTRNVSEYMLVLALCLVILVYASTNSSKTRDGKSREQENEKHPMRPKEVVSTEWPGIERVQVQTLADISRSRYVAIATQPVGLVHKVCVRPRRSGFKLMLEFKLRI